MNVIPLISDLQSDTLRILHVYLLTNIVYSYDLPKNSLSLPHMFEQLTNLYEHTPKGLLQLVTQVSSTVPHFF